MIDLRRMALAKLVQNLCQVSIDLSDLDCHNRAYFELANSESAVEVCQMFRVQNYFLHLASNYSRLKMPVLGRIDLFVEFLCVSP